MNKYSNSPHIQFSLMILLLLVKLPLLIIIITLITVLLLGANISHFSKTKNLPVKSTSANNVTIHCHPSVF